MVKNNSLLIQQPKQFKKVIQDLYDTNKKDYYILVDSRDRNHDLYLNPNNYQVEFDNVLRSVISIELISAELPAVQSGNLKLCDGQDLVWFGSRTSSAMQSLTGLFTALL